jgi:hypothetical protein
MDCVLGPNYTLSTVKRLVHVRSSRVHVRNLAYLAVIETGHSHKDI